MITFAAHEARRLILAGTAPRGMQVEGNIFIRGCYSREHLADMKTEWLELPEDLRVVSLDLRSSHVLRQLPRGLRCSGSLLLSGCRNLQSLPEDLSVGAALHLDFCVGLQRLPETLAVGEVICMVGTKIESIPSSLRHVAILRTEKERAQFFGGKERQWVDLIE